MTHGRARARPDEGEEFEQFRPLLFGIAYRMLGSAMDAEDVVQEAFLRGRCAPPEEVRSPRAYLSTVVTRLSIDLLRSARVRREQYVGPWLPEPLLLESEPDIADRVALDESLSLAFLVLLERLSPVERAVFLLRDVFAYPYAEIANIVGKTEANCRQLAVRARRHVTEGGQRFEPSPERRDALTATFMRACAEGDLATLVSALADDAVLWADGGGVVTAARRPIHGAEHIARFLLGIIRHAPAGFTVHRATVNGEPGIVVSVGGRPISVFAFHVEDGRIRAIYNVANPEKLRAIGRHAGGAGSTWTST